VLAVLAAANFCATTRIAQLIGQDVSGLLFHMGPSQSIHVFNMNRDYILVALFGNDLPVGVVRLGCARASEQMLPILPAEEEEAPCHS
jgi:predicted regulator of Ras-like GTPase activity (Roadblock/LC7/MglB family)